MAKNSQTRTILLCGGILLVVLFFLGVFKMKEGFYVMKKCADRTNKTGCEDMDGCAWTGSSNNTSGGTCKVSNCGSMNQTVCGINSNECTWDEVDYYGGATFGGPTFKCTTK